jgi:hypothetical protein
MKVAGFTIIKNAIKYDYPVVEAINSVLPLCDVFYVGVGKSEDNTRQLIQAIPSEKVIIVDTVWDDSLREGGLVLSNETNKVFDSIPDNYTWCFYIQSDECVHENDYQSIKSAMQKHKNDTRVDGLLFEYKHFYGQYNYIGVGRRWYKNEIRIVRNDKCIRSYKDAQGFRKNGEKLKVKSTGAYIYHYGWVKAPKAQQAKQEDFNKLWHDDDWVKKHVAHAEEYDYSNIDLLAEYKGSHPKVFEKRIREAGWQFEYDNSKVNRNFKYRLLYWIERLTGWRLGEYKNYKLI